MLGLDLDINSPVIHTTLYIAAGAVLLGASLHELGHLTAAKLFGISQSRLILLPGRLRDNGSGLVGFIKRYAAVAAIDIPLSELLTLPVWKRRVIFLAGCAFDVLAAMLICAISAPLPDIIQQGVILGALVRIFVGLPVNLIPIAAVKNDGWRIFNPNSEE